MLLVDAAQGIEAQTLANLYLALDRDLRHHPGAEQDRPARRRPGSLRRRARPHHRLRARRDVLRVSGKTGEGVTELLDEVVRQVPAADRRRRRTGPRDDLRLGLRHLPRRGHLRPRGRRQDRAARTHQDDVHRRHPRAARSRHRLAGTEGVRRPRRRRGGLPDHRREGCPPVEGRRHGHGGPPRGHRTADRLSRAPPDGVLGAVSGRRIRLSGIARRAGQAAAQRRRADLRAGDVGGAGLRLPLRLPRACCTWRSPASGSSASSTST